MTEQRPKPHSRLHGTAMWLAENIAPLHTEVVLHLRQELSLYDGYGLREESVQVTTSSSTSSTERDAQRRLNIQHDLDNISSSLQALFDAAHNHANNLRAIKRRIPPPTTTSNKCRDNQRNRDGTIEWGDPLCEQHPTTRTGLCARCYLREWRWRRDHQLPEREPGLLPRDAA